MIKIKIISFLFLVLFLNSISLAKEPSKLISEIVNEASLILSSSDPVEAKIINIDETWHGDFYTNKMYKKEMMMKLRKIWEEKDATLCS